MRHASQVYFMRIENRESTLRFEEGCWIGEFVAMASPCQLLIDGGDQAQARLCLDKISSDAWRIETTYSRYRDDNIVHEIHNAKGSAVIVDDETARLLDFSAELYEMSEGLFDITSGVLRRVWDFNGSDQIPEQLTINKVLPLVGWHKVRWEKPYLTLPTDMQIDFGGIGKEYAVDRAAGLMAENCARNFLVNFGGDMFVSGPRDDGRAWRTAIENPDKPGTAVSMLDVYKGALATSGDARRFLLRDDVRYSHVLNPKTGWPVIDAPHSMTVAASTCVEAGMLSTLSLLQGANAEKFLDEQGVEYWCIR